MKRFVAMDVGGFDELIPDKDYPWSQWKLFFSDCNLCLKLGRDKKGKRKEKVFCSSMFLCLLMSSPPHLVYFHRVFFIVLAGKKSKRL